MKAILAILTLMSAMILGSCSDIVSPTSADTSKTYVNDVAKIQLKTATDRQGLTLNITLTNIVKDRLFPQAESEVNYLRIKVLNHYTETAIDWRYGYYDFCRLFGTDVLQSDFNYSAVIYIDIRDLPPDVDYGKITVALGLTREYLPDMIYSFDVDVNYDFAR